MVIFFVLKNISWLQ